jgi:hypothetical protein
LPKRHRRKPPPQCVTAESENAKEKRIETERAHEVFKDRLRELLRTGEGIWIPFSQIMKEKYPDSVKKKRARGSGVGSKDAANQGYYFHTYRLDDLRV